MKKIARFLAAVVMTAIPVRGGDLAGQATLGYQQYDFGLRNTNGFRQTYTLRLNRELSDAALFQLSFRGEQFDGTERAADASSRSSSRLLQPSGLFTLELGSIQATIKSDYIAHVSDLNDAVAAKTTTERTLAAFSWTPERLPAFTVIAQRNAARDDASYVNITDEYVLASARYDLRRVQLNASEHLSRSTSPTLGYTRDMTTHAADIQYADTYADGRLTLAGQAGARLTSIDQRATTGGPTSVPNPIAVSRALWGVDETPADSSDRPLVPTRALVDGNLSQSAGIALGPEGSSFHNIAIDSGRIDRVDELRIIVRDRAGDPLRRGGGAVTWDAYTSVDGVLWTQIPDAAMSFNGPLSYYSVTFDTKLTRWVKVVSFGLHVEEAFVTEIQGFYHSTIAPGVSRQSDQDSYGATFSSTLQPTKKMTLSYSGVFNSVRQSDQSLPELESNDVSHVGRLEYQLASAWGVRGEYTNSTSDGFGGLATSLDGYHAFVDYKPTLKLRLSGEYGSDQQRLAGSTFSIDTLALHGIAYILPSLSATLDAGIQDQQFVDGLTSERQFGFLTVNAQLTRTLRGRITGSLQRSDGTSQDPAVLLLGPERDTRGTFDLIWRPGDKIAFTGRFGYADAAGFSGVTQRYQLEWLPFGEGNVSFAGSFDQDINPSSGRRATRVVFNPRWAINRHTILDVNYTAVSNSSAAETKEQRTAFATLTLTK